jgi:hypothetical protein
MGNGGVGTCAIPKNPLACQPVILFKMISGLAGYVNRFFPVWQGIQQGLTPNDEGLVSSLTTSEWSLAIPDQLVTLEASQLIKKYDGRTRGQEPLYPRGTRRKDEPNRAGLGERSSRREDKIRRSASHRRDAPTAVALLSASSRNQCHAEAALRSRTWDRRAVSGAQG